MNTVSQIAQALQEILNERVEVLAKETKFIQRVREVKGADFAQTLIFGWQQEADVTMDGLTQILQRREVTISGPGLSQRFTLAQTMNGNWPVQMEWRSYLDRHTPFACS